MLHDMRKKSKSFLVYNLIVRTLLKEIYFLPLMHLLGKIVKAESLYSRNAAKRWHAVESRKLFVIYFDTCPLKVQKAFGKYA